MINWKNTTENLGIILITMVSSSLLSAFITYKVALKSMDNTLEKVTPTLIEAIKKETTAINNDIDNTYDFDKIKIKKSDSVNINITPKTQTSSVLNKTHTIDGNTNLRCIDILKLNKRNRRRLNRIIKSVEKN